MSELIRQMIAVGRFDSTSLDTTNSNNLYPCIYLYIYCNPFSYIVEKWRKVSFKCPQMRKEIYLTLTKMNPPYEGSIFASYTS